MRRQLAPEDRTLIYRLVGFYEYLNALQKLDTLMAITDDEEKQVIDELIRDEDEFAVFTNLSRRLKKNGQTSLAESPKKAEDKFERRGLAWVLALARVEVGAMLAGFTNSYSPFEAVRPTKYEMTAYKELLEDGMRTHYWALVNDPMFRPIIAKSNVEADAATIAYVRRLTVARAFHDAASRIGAGQLSPTQIAELKTWQNDLSTLQNGLVQNIERYLRQTRTEQSSNTTSKTSEYTRKVNGARACYRQLQGERYEIQNGLARIETETFK